MIDKNLYLYLSFYTRIFVNFLSQESVGTFGHCGFAQQRTFTCFYLQVYLNPFNCVWFKMKISWDCPLYYCSVDSLLLSRSVDPEEVLLSLGFGGCSRSVARIPPRFFSTKSHVSYFISVRKAFFKCRTEKNGIIILCLYLYFTIWRTFKGTVSRVDLAFDDMYG
jgi:hypothetical protein